MIMMIIYKNIKCLVPCISLTKVSFYFHLQQLRFSVCKQQKLTNLGREEIHKNREAYRKGWELGTSRPESRVWVSGKYQLAKTMNKCQAFSSSPCFTSFKIPCSGWESWLTWVICLSLRRDGGGYLDAVCYILGKQYYTYPIREFVIKISTKGCPLLKKETQTPTKKIYSRSLY